VFADETEKVAVDIAFRSEIRSMTRGQFAAVGEALRESDTVLGDGLAALVKAIAATIPWLIVIIPAFGSGPDLFVEFTEDERPKSRRGRRLGG